MNDERTLCDTPLRRRRNMVSSIGETWRPPLLSSPGQGSSGLGVRIRRFLDLQLGSIWRDLACELPSVSGTVLDVGCGAQPYRPLLLPAATYLGIDTADSESHFGYRVPDTTYYSGDTWPVPNASCDLVLCTETLEHVLDPCQFLAEAVRVMRPGGRLILTVPFAARWHFIPCDYWRYTPSGLQHLLTRAGLEQIAVYARGNRLTVACYKVMALILPLLMPQSGGAVRRRMLQIVGLLLSPWLLVLAAIGNASLRGRGGDDCLGYTVLARRPPAEPRKERN